MLLTNHFSSGRELSYAQQYGVAAALSVPLFFIAGAGSAVFWVLGKFGIYIMKLHVILSSYNLCVGVSFFLVAMHASFHVSPDEASVEEPFMETV